MREGGSTWTGANSKLQTCLCGSCGFFLRPETIFDVEGRPLRYVILRHEMPAAARGDAARGLHWDLMLERGSALQTWAIDVEPAFHVLLRAEPLADHRSEYLDYQGPVSRNRGFVRQWDAGTFQLETDEPCRVVVQLHQGRMAGRLELETDLANDSYWTARFCG